VIVGRIDVSQDQGIRPLPPDRVRAEVELLRLRKALSRVGSNEKRVEGLGLIRLRDLFVLGLDVALRLVIDPGYLAA
jgi:hypothetical protein